MFEKLKNNPLPVIFFTVFVDLLGFGILIPVIPQLLAAPRSPYFLLPHNLTISQGYIILGFLTATFPLMQFLSTPILGQLSDRYGRKKILAIALAGTCTSYIVFAIGIMTKNIPLLFLARAFDGITGGNISVAQAAIADITTPQNRAKNFGLIGAAFGLGFIAGPYIGGKLSDPAVVSWFNATTPFFFAAILSFTNVISVLAFFPETLENTLTDLKITWNQSIINVAKAFKSAELSTVFTTVFFFNAGFAFFVTFFSVYLISRFSFTQGNIGDFFSFVGLWIVFAQAVITRRAAKFFKDFQILRVSIMMVSIFIMMLLVPSVWWGLLLIVPFFAMANGLSQANIQSLVSRSAGPQIQGEILGINASVMAAAQTIPPVLSGFIAAKLTPQAPIVVSSLVILLASLIFIYLYKPTEAHLN